MRTLESPTHAHLLTLCFATPADFQHRAAACAPRPAAAGLRPAGCRGWQRQGPVCHSAHRGGRYRVHRAAAGECFALVGRRSQTTLRTQPRPSQKCQAPLPPTTHPQAGVQHVVNKIEMPACPHCFRALGARSNESLQHPDSVLRSCSCR